MAAERFVPDESDILEWHWMDLVEAAEQEESEAWLAAGLAQAEEHYMMVHEAWR